MSAILMLLRNRARRIGRCEDGAALVEFGFTFPLMLLAVVGTIEILAMLFAGALIEGGLREASRFGVTGFEPAGMSRKDRIVELVNRAGIGLVTVSANDISTKVYSTFDSIGKPEPYIDANANDQYDLGESFDDINGNGQWDADMGAEGVGGAGDVVVYSLDYRWPLLMPGLVPFIGSDGGVTLSASVAVRNEPYDSNPAP